MIGLVLLLTAASIILTNGIPIEVNSPYLEYPEEYKENYNNPNYVNLPKTSYELPQLLQSNSKRDSKNSKTPNGNDIMDYHPYPAPLRYLPGGESPSTAGPTKPPTPFDYYDSHGKRSFKSQELYEKLIALGLDYIEATNIIEALYRLQFATEDRRQKCPIKSKH